MQVMDCMKICLVPLIPIMLTLKMSDQRRSVGSDDDFIHAFTLPLTFVSSEVQPAATLSFPLEN